jgi:hypothetical protein
MHDSQTNPDPVPEGSAVGDHRSPSAVQDGQAAEQPQTSAKRPTLQQRFEESRIGMWIVSAIIVVIVGVQVVWSVPDSPIRRGLMPIVEPANVVGINIPWAMFSGNPTPRIEDFEVEVTMADGSTRTWKLHPRSRLEKVFLPNRWEGLRDQAMRQQDGRRDFARWVVREVTGPSERPVKVVMMFHFKALMRPGQQTLGQIGTKILYEEVLTERP